MKIAEKNVRKKPAEKYTFIIIPSTTAKTLKINLSRQFINGAVMLLVFVMLISLITIYKYYASREEINRVETIKQENQDKENTIKVLRKEIQEIENQQETLLNKQNEIKKMMGIKEEYKEGENPSRGGQGGPDTVRRRASTGDTINRIQKLETSLILKEKEANKLLARVKKDQVYYCALPNQSPAPGDITSSYGWRKSPFGGRRQVFHDGIDIANCSGTPVVAAGDGEVIYAEWKSAYGKLVEIDHGYGWVTKYGHNSRLLVKKGDKVKKGQVIAYMGSTGRSTGPHLHFSLLKAGDTQDPQVYLP